MKIDIVMPQLWQSIAEGTITRWLKKPGDAVQKDETLLEVSTDKVESEVPAPQDGTLLELLAQEGETIEVGKPIAVLEGQGAEARPAPKREMATATASAPSSPSSGGPTARRSGGRFYSPAVRRLAREAGMQSTELDALPGSGSGGRLTKNDLQRHLDGRSRPAAPEAPLVYSGDDVEVVPMDNMRKAIAAHMVRSVQTSPHVTTVQEVDMTGVVKHRAAHKATFEREEGFKLTVTPYVASVVARQLREYPWVNASVDGDRILVHRRVHLGIAVALERGLVVPVIRDADTLSLRGLARALHAIAEKARRGELKNDDFQGATFTITNPGVFGSLIGTPIINQPQVAILSTGVIQKRVVVVEDDAIAVRSMMFLSLSYDHRLIDGALAGRFTRSVVERLASTDPSAAL
ncbi:MAG: dihydrolipoamide acetyltransferase family protein [Planctomycetota bacterium]